MMSKNSAIQQDRGDALRIWLTDYGHKIAFLLQYLAGYHETTGRTSSCILQMQISGYDASGMRSQKPLLFWVARQWHHNWNLWDVATRNAAQVTPSAQARLLRLRSRCSDRMPWPQASTAACAELSCRQHSQSVQLGIYGAGGCIPTRTLVKGV